MAKNMIVGIILAIILGGIGLAYAGNVRLGIILFVAQLLFAILGSVLFGPIAILAFLAWLASLILTIKTIKEGNAAGN